MIGLLLIMAVPQAGDAGICAAGPAEMFEGQRYRRHVPSKVKRLTGSRAVRVLMPGEMATQDFREDRVTIRIDYRRRVASIRCG